MATRPMRIRAVEKDGVVEVKALMSHIMETGQRKDKDGKIIPPTSSTSCKPSATTSSCSMPMGPAVSRDPFLAFKFKGGKKGDKLTLSWKDNEGESRTDTTEIR